MRNAGVLDAGVVLTRLDPRRRGAAAVAALLDRPSPARRSFHLSAVNLAEVFEHSRDYLRDTGIDLASVLDSLQVAIHAPGIDVAREVAALARLPRVSLGDRFAAATARVLGARLYTTDSTLAGALRRGRVGIPVTLF